MSYELANRPDWVAIPLNGILRVLAKGSDARERRAIRANSHAAAS